MVLDTGFRYGGEFEILRLVHTFLRLLVACLSHKMPSRISKWLSSYKPSSREAMDEFITWMYSSNKLVDDIEETFEKLISSNTISDVCQRLFVFYKSGLPALQNFVVLLLPSLLHSYLCHSYEDNSSSSQTRKIVPNISDSSQSSFLASLSLLESYLLSICNYYLVKADPLKSKSEGFISDINNFRLPSLTTPSVFHNPVSIKETIERNDANVKTESENLNPLRVSAIICLVQNYIEILSTIDLQNPIMSLLVFHSLSRFSKFSDRVVSISKRPRIPTSSGLLMVLLDCSDLILFKLDCFDKYSGSNNRLTDSIRSSILDNIIEISNRATHHCFSSCLLVCQSLLHYRSIYYNYCDQKPRMEDGYIRDIENSPTSRNGLTNSAHIPPMISINSPEDKTPRTEYTPRPKLSSTNAEVFTSASFKPEIVSEDITPVSENSRSSRPDKMTGPAEDVNNGASASDNINKKHSSELHERKHNKLKIGVDFRIKPNDHRKHTLERLSAHHVKSNNTEK
ncbi:unnamed protein product [Schistosoma rodhaini]|uniref:Hyccin n=1 Tax=Schistosoma rodhaini TaxID=6188 RepID=A0AA85FFN7_9TREM|nr:unnamed protein product [Schistosoma rodhaini]